MNVAAVRDPDHMTICKFSSGLIDIRKSNRVAKRPKGKIR